MNLTIDIGNTCTKLVAFNGFDIIEELRINGDEWYKLHDFCKKHRFENGIYSTVVNIPDEKQMLLHELPFPITQFIPGKTPIPINNLYETPNTLGADRLAAVIGAYYKKVGKNILVIDVGTCITFDFVTSEGNYLGGNISPGPILRFKALNAYTSRLPLVNNEGCTNLLGTTTETAIRNGVINGIKYEILGFVSELKKTYTDFAIYKTGGVDIDFGNCVDGIEYEVDNLIVSEGLNRILFYNLDKK